MQLTVDLAQRSYPIIIESGLLTQTTLWQPYIAGKQVCIVSNDTVAPLYLEALQSALGLEKLTCCILPDGEIYKQQASIDHIYSHLLTQGYNRQSILIALGGGVIGDMTGFAAATYQRGIQFIQVPTTLLAQVDSSVGGKTGINHALGKNMIGAFKQPLMVVIDIDTLRSLPMREFCSGIAEVIKYGLIYDASFYAWCHDNMERLVRRDAQALIYAIEQSCLIKAKIVAQDEHETGMRAILNLGHTFGHAIEAEIGYGQWLHGEAVAVGMLMACQVSHWQGWLTQDQVQQLSQLLVRAGLPITMPAGLDVQCLLQRMSVDKKNIDHRIRLVLLQSIGQACVTHDYKADYLPRVLGQFTPVLQPV